MWKNVFIEALLLSVFIFGGFYINANLMTKEINLTQKTILSEKNPALAKLHLSGSWFGSNGGQAWGNLSGNETAPDLRSSVSGFPQKPDSTNISGNKA